MPPPLGERGGHTPSLWQKNQMNFCIQTVSKITPFFNPTFLNRPHSEKPLRAWKRILPSFRLEMLARVVEIPCFFPSVSRNTSIFVPNPFPVSPCLIKQVTSAVFRNAGIGL